MIDDNYQSLYKEVREYDEAVLNAKIHQQLLQVQGGNLCPSVISMPKMHRVLDLGCGTGDWIFDLALRYSHLTIYGIDTNEAALEQAIIRRNVSGLRQVELRQVDFLQTLPLPDNYLDLVHIRRNSYV